LQVISVRLARRPNCKEFWAEKSIGGFVRGGKFLIIKSNKFINMNFPSRAFGGVIAVLFVFGIILHVSRILIGFEPSSIPRIVDVIILIGALYGGIGYLKFWKDIYFPKVITKVLYGIITFHLLGSVFIHAFIIAIPNNKILDIFPIWYSYIMVAVMALFAYYSWNVKFKE